MEKYEKQQQILTGDVPCQELWVLQESLKRVVSQNKFDGTALDTNDSITYSTKLIQEAGTHKHEFWIGNTMYS